MPLQTQYQQKRMPAAEAIGVVMNGDTVVVPPPWASRLPC